MRITGNKPAMVRNKRQLTIAITTDIPTSINTFLARVASETGHFSGAFVDFTNSQPSRPGDVLSLELEKGDGTALGQIGRRTLSEEAIAASALHLGEIVMDLPPLRTLIEHNFPNPFNASTTIYYQLAKPGKVTLRVYDVRGRLVKTLVKREMRPGYYKAIWNGKDDRDRGVASGVYLIRFTATDVERSYKMVLVK